MINSGIIYDGPSLIDGKPIVAIAVYSNRNLKTGPMVQTYIIRSDIDPRDANKSGADKSICGDCNFMGTPNIDPKRKLAKDRICYVNIGQGPLIVYKSYKRGIYPVLDKPFQISKLGENRFIRFGTYGDPAAIPIDVWNKLTAVAIGHTGYTHQWRKSKELQGYCMASADSESDAIEAQEQGWRTFRVIPKADKIPPHDNEINCPASKEAGAKTNCAKCLLCMGTASNSPKSIYIRKH